MKNGLNPLIGVSAILACIVEKRRRAGDCLDVKMRTRFMREQMYIPSGIEICAGGGGQALGLEAGGFAAECLVEIDGPSCDTLRTNRSNWKVFEQDVRSFDASPYQGVDLVAGGVPCPPFSLAGKQLGSDDERDLFPEAIRIVDETRPRAVMLENVRGFLSPQFYDYRERLKEAFHKLGYLLSWHLLHASDFGVSQLRPRVVIIALQKQYSDRFRWPMGNGRSPCGVGELLFDLMSENGWKGARDWALHACGIAPTLVGGSKKTWWR